MLVLICVGTLNFFLQWCLGWNAHTVVLGSGLLLDIVGAAILAIPDIPSIYRWFFSGKVQEAVDLLETKPGTSQNILIEPDTNDRLIDSLYIVEEVSGEPIGESSLLDTVTRTSDPPTNGFYELREMFYSLTNDSLWHDVFGFKVYEDEENDIRTYILYQKDGEIGVKVKGDYYNSFNGIYKSIERSEARYRRLGLSLLISGFAFQGASLIV
ncbi:hypothetical protein ACFQE1_07030 [Halobium palmae]|uniref:SMODS-associating 2TM beta-strand rich effector domain-containing protein n=1 Tax=Halobium palmae TaxID=1776492 RepID=A0ABD5RXU9_9EURY